MNIVDTILFQCRINAERPALAAPGSRFGLVSYSLLEYMINNITRTLVPFGFRPGQIVGISVEDKILHVALMLALMRIRVMAVSCRSPDLPADLNARAIIADRAHPASGAEQSIQITPEWAMARGETSPVAAFAANTDDEPCCILRSDSAGALKFVSLSHSQLANRTAQLEYSFGHRWPQNPRLYCSIDLSSEAALRCTIYTLMRGGLVLFFGENIASTVQSINLFGIQKMIVTPQGLEDHLRAYEESGIDCNLDHIVLVDPNISSALLERARARMSTHIFVEFSRPEVGMIASANVRTVSSMPGTAGYVVPPAIVEVVDETGKPSPAGVAGVVRVRSPNMASGYLGAGSSAPCFRDGWYYTADPGYLNEDGLLVIER